MTRAVSVPAAAQPPATRTSPRAASGRTSGFTLLELLIAMTIGLVILAASLMVYTSSSRGSQVSQLETQLNEDGILALNLIQQQLKQAGYSQQIIPPSGATVYGNYAGLAVRGCDSGFADTSVDFDLLSCAASGTPAIAIRYEATTDDTMPTAAGLPTNCLGNGINALTASQASPAPAPPTGAPAPYPPNYALADNRYFISTGTDGRPNLSCRGMEKNAGGTANIIGTAQLLLANIENMTLTYGVASRPSLQLASSYDPTLHQIVGYLSAAGVDALATTGTVPNTTQDRWGRVLSVRVCLLMRSDQPVRDAPDGGFKYKACDNTDATGNDGYLRQAFTTTVLLRNRLMIQ